MTSAQDRNRGIRFEFLRMRPHDHMAWVFAGRGEFAILATSYLAEGAALGERLMYVAQDPDPADVAGLTEVVGAGALQVASIAEVYGPAGIVDPQVQRATFAVALADALAAGHSGIRIAADNTSLVADDERLKAWLRWEVVADRFLADSQVTGLCAFDEQKVDARRLRRLATLHPLSSASGPIPPFRLFSACGELCVEGQVDCLAVTPLWLALDNLPPKTPVLVDLHSATLLSRGVLAGLGQLCNAGVDVTIQGGSVAIEDLRRSLTLPSDRLVLREAQRQDPGRGVSPRAAASAAS